MNSFWEKLPKPLFVLAPMADVTDPAYRKLIAEYGKPDVTWTEFVSADGLYHTREKGVMSDEENPLVRDLQFTEGEHPIVAQLFSSNPENMAYAAAFCRDQGFDGIDINMGCPDRSIEKQGCGSAMIKNPELAAKVIAAARTAGIPVSVKTRIGYNTEDIDGWIRFLLEQKLPALTVHLRTRKEMSKVEAHWDLMPRVVALRNEISPETLIIGNGDVKDLEDAREKVRQYGCDGVMFGRAIFGNPMLFSNRSKEDFSREKRIYTLSRLARYFDELRPQKSFHILKKHVKSFISEFDGAPQLRAKLLDSASIEEFLQILDSELL